jgi:5'-phosphate synthase pdxT subunit
MLSKNVLHKTAGQKTLEIMDIDTDRNAYGRQKDSFETMVNSKLGQLQTVFIRAPKILKISKGVNILAEYKKEIIACEQRKKDSFYAATTFHPELTSTIFHEYFLRNLII